MEPTPCDGGSPPMPSPSKNVLVLMGAGGGGRFGGISLSA